MIESKNAQVRRLVSQGEYKQALQICKEWDYADPHHREILRRGYECLLYPGFYKQLGHDPDSAYQEAIKILHIVYDN